MKAAAELARVGRLPVNVRIECDGEEEIGGHSIVDFLRDDERGADAAVIFDSAMPQPDVPAFDLATRGLVYFHVRLRTGGHDLHSGVFGGAALNAVHALMRTLDAVVAVPEELRAGVAPPTEEELASWAALEPGAEVLELRYGLDGKHPRTLDEVGRAFNVTRERIRQIENRSLKKLHALADAITFRDVA